MRRKALVKIAFTVLDKDKSGVVTVEDLINVYDATCHPDVVAGKRSAKSVLQEFLGAFEVGGEKDGLVYYTCLITWSRFLPN